MSKLDDLEKIQELKAKGILTQEEFETEKEKILGRNKYTYTINENEEKNEPVKEIEEFEHQSINKKNYKKLIFILVPIIIILVVISLFIFNSKIISNNDITNVNNSSINKTDNNNMINTNKNPVATMEIKDYGTVKIELYPDVAPNTVNNFINLANNGFYDNLTFHRVIKDFMIQGGDKNGDGTGNPLLSDLNNTTPTTEDKEYAIKGEFELNGYNNSLEHTEGVISMARADYSAYGKTEEGYNSAGSQFFIITETSPNLDGSYASFGKVTEGMEIIHKIENISTNENNEPIEKVVIKSIKVDTFGKKYELPETIDVYDIYSNIDEDNSNYYEHPQEWYDEQEKIDADTSSNNSSSSTSNNNNRKHKNIDDVLNDPEYFTKYSLNLVNNAKTLSIINNYEELNMKENWSDLTPYSIYYNDTSLDYTSPSTSSYYIWNEDETNPIYSAKFIYNYNGNCYVRKGVDLSKIKIEYHIEYQGKEKGTNNYKDFGFIFTPKLKVDGNKLMIDINADSITDRFYG